MLSRPDTSEYVDYYHRYVSKVPDGNVLDILERQIEEAFTTLSAVDEAKANYRYEPGKWSLKQVIGHMCDVERLFQYRALVFARSDKTPLPAFEQDDYVANANFDTRTMSDLVAEYRAIRASTLAMFRSFNPEAFALTGTASGFEFTVRAVAYILAGHERHHLDVIKDRYL
jgi:hypothetical protein